MDLELGALAEATMNPFPIPDTASKFAPSYWTLVGEWMREVGGHQLRTVQGVMSVDELHEFIISAARRSIPAGLGDDARYGLTWTEIVQRAEECSEYLVETYRPRHTFTPSERRKGGRRGKRTSDLLKALQGLPEGLTNQQVAERLHCHIRTVSKLRAMHRRQVEQNMPADLRDLLGESTEVDHSTGEVIEEQPTVIHEMNPVIDITEWQIEKLRAAEIAERLQKADAENPDWLLAGMEL